MSIIGSFMRGVHQGQDRIAQARQMQELEETRKLRMENMRLNNEMRQSQITKNKEATEQMKFKMALPGLSALSSSNDDADWRNIYKVAPYEKVSGNRFTGFVQRTDVPAMVDDGVLKRQVENKDGSVTTLSDDMLYNLAKSMRLQKFIGKDHKEKFLSSASIEASLGITAFRTEQEKKRLEMETTKYKNEAAKLKYQQDFSKAQDGFMRQKDVKEANTAYQNFLFDNNGELDSSRVKPEVRSKILSSLEHEATNGDPSKKNTVYSKSVKNALVSASIMSGTDKMIKEASSFKTPRQALEAKMFGNKYITDLGTTIGTLATQFKSQFMGASNDTERAKVVQENINEMIDNNNKAVEYAKTIADKDPELARYIQFKAQMAVKVANLLKHKSGSAVNADEFDRYQDLYTGGNVLGSMDNMLNYMKGALQEEYDTARSAIKRVETTDKYSALRGDMELRSMYPNGLHQTITSQQQPNQPQQLNTQPQVTVETQWAKAIAGHPERDTPENKEEFTRRFNAARGIQ